jgi:GNAT superfamily N-acetyltransferase
MTDGRFPADRSMNAAHDARFATAVDGDAAAIAALRTAVAERLTRDFGPGHWSGAVTEKSVLRAIRTARLVVARNGGRIVGTLRLATKKPWAIDAKYFTQVRRPLYLTDMAVDPAVQRAGIGRQLLDEAVAVAKAWPADAIRLDSYDANAGAGPFYAKCGLREVARVTYRGTPLIYFEMML